MTARAVVLGLLGSCLICLSVILNRHFIHQTNLVGNQLPVAVFGTLVFFLLVINPLLWWVRKSLALTGKEIAVIVAMSLAACSIPGSNMARILTPALILPHHHQHTEAGWDRHGLVEMVPERMLTEVGEETRDEVLGGYLWGMPRPKGQAHIGLLDIPWSAWLRTLSFWGPLLLCLWIGLIGLSLVMHRQWSQHELLAYPISRFANSLLPDKGRCLGGVFHERLFWIAAVTVAVIHLNNYAHVWFPDHTIFVQRRFDLSGIADLFPTFKKGNEYHLVQPYIYFSVIAFGYFLASDVSLSLGIGPFFYCLLSGVLIGHGISLEGGGHMHPRPLTFMQFGAFLAMFTGLVIMGRSYYMKVFRGAFGLPVLEPAESAPVWGARVFCIGLAGFVAMLWAVGLDWQLAVLYAILTVILFVVLGRVVAETGFYALEARWFPCVVMMGFFGPMSLTPDAYVLVMLVSVVIVGSPGEALMPYIVNGLKLLELKRVQIGPPALWCAITLFVALVFSVVVTLYIEYDQGMNRRDFSIMEHGSKYAFHETIQVANHLEAQGTLEEARSITGWGRFLRLAPEKPFLAAFCSGIAFVASFAFLRLRFARWPLHPVLFVTWGTSPGVIMAVSFLIGWFIKAFVGKFAGGAGYQKLKPLMIGLIAGDMIGSIGPLIIGTVIRFVTNLPTPVFSSMPM